MVKLVVLGPVSFGQMTQEMFLPLWNGIITAVQPISQYCCNDQIRKLI